MASVSELLFSSRLVVCVGTGGVGKTTTSAALALRAARHGRRVLVLTIDPARRLANAMGLASLGNTPQAVDLGAGASGSLHAMMLDAKQTFDDLIRRTAGSEAGAILGNRIYQLMSERLTGTQEYMALERLFDLYQAGTWDLVVLDTPPSTNALDFFDAPRRTAQMFDESVMRWFLPEVRTADSSLWQRVFNPGAVVLKLLAVVGGDAFIAELSQFFEAMRIVRASFQERGHRVQEILRARDTHYVLVASPDARRVDEAMGLHDRLREMGKSVSACVLNRAHTEFFTEDLALMPESLDPETALLRELYARVVCLAERERAGVARLQQVARHASVVVVPAFTAPVVALAQLDRLGEALSQ